MLASLEFARGAWLVVFMMLVQLRALLDPWNLALYVELLLCLAAGALYTTMAVTKDVPSPCTGISFLVALAFGLLLMLRVSFIESTCDKCPPYEDPCYLNPYAVGSELDWTNFDTYDRDLIVNVTLTFNPSSDVEEEGILDNIQSCWTMGCTPCTGKTHDWRIAILVGNAVDVALNVMFGFLLICINSM